MIEVRFHEEFYDGFAIDEAVKLYAPYANFTLKREAGGFIVQVEGKPEDQGGADPSLVAAELMNYALGKTIERSRAAESAASETASAAPETASASPGEAA
ncbi:MAG: hypothetical protein IPK82_12750 [Polyangiaceae bacterium]|nr:hypothetical protein [Polyangiaceae bacterium]